MTTTVIKRGPLFDGRAAHAVRDYTSAAAREVGETAEDLVRAAAKVFRHPTGYYESQITVNRASANAYLVTDNDVVYGPWLEGVGSRNRTTRFKGYHFWRLAAQQADRRAVPVAERVLLPYLARMR
jgi:hypothetical protein